MKTLTMVHEGVEYEFNAYKYGWSYAEMSISIRKKLFGFITYQSVVFSTSSGFYKTAYPALIDDVRKAKKEKMIRWAENALAEYLEYKESWEGK